MDSQRGLVQYQERFNQKILFEGIVRHRGITPTDIDGLIDYNGKAFVYLEAKHEGKDIDTGQRRALENLVQSHIKAEHQSICILFRHRSGSGESIIAKDMMVDSVYNGKEWRRQIGMTVLQAIEKYESWLISRHIDI